MKCLSRICLSGLLFLFIAGMPVMAMESTDEISSPFSQKPKGVSALAWLQQLEGERDKVDLNPQLSLSVKSLSVETLSKEISATLAGKYGFAQRLATPDERQLMLSSLLKTRDRFAGKPDIIHDFYFHYDQEGCWRRVETDPTFAQHMAVIAAADAIHQGLTNAKQIEMRAQSLVAAISETNWKHLTDEVKEISTDHRLQKLEDQRDVTDFRNFTEFKTLTNQISLLLSSFKAVPNGKILHRWIDSLIRTRHKFSGQRCLGKDGMINRYVQHLTDLENAEYRNQIATILILDATVKLAITDEDFLTLWSMQSSDAKISEAFIEGVLKAAAAEQFGWPKETITSLTDAICTVLATRPDIVRLSGDIFDLYAPKLDLKGVYNEVMLSGGVYRGWTVHRLDTFGHLVNLTDAEKAMTPGLETQIRSKFIGSINTSHYDLYSTSTRGILSSEFSESSQFSENGIPLATLNYVFDICLADRGCGVVGKGPVHFYLTRNVNPDLQHLLCRNNGLLDDSYISDLQRPFSNETFDSAYEKGILVNIGIWATKFMNGTDGVVKNLPKAIELYRESVELGFEPAKRKLAIVLNNHAADFVNGTNGIVENWCRAIELCREAVDLGFEPAKENLAIALHHQAVDFIIGTNGIVINLPKGIELCREAVDLGFEPAKGNLAIALNNYAIDFNNGTNGVEQNRSRAIELYRESVELGYEPAKRDLAIVLYNHANELNNGTNGIEKNSPKAIELFIESAELGCEPAKRNLAELLKTNTFP